MTLWEEATLYDININYRVPQAKTNRTGLMESPFEELHGEMPSLDDFRPFGCRGYVIFQSKIQLCVCGWSSARSGKLRAIILL